MLEHVHSVREDVHALEDRDEPVVRKRHGQRPLLAERELVQRLEPRPLEGRKPPEWQPVLEVVWELTARSLELRWQQLHADALREHAPLLLEVAKPLPQVQNVEAELVEEPFVLQAHVLLCGFHAPTLRVQVRHRLGRPVVRKRQHQLQKLEELHWRELVQKAKREQSCVRRLVKPVVVALQHPLDLEARLHWPPRVGRQYRPVAYRVVPQQLQLLAVVAQLATEAVAREPWSRAAPAAERTVAALLEVLVETVEVHHVAQHLCVAAVRTEPAQQSRRSSVLQVAVPSLE